MAAKKDEIATVVDANVVRAEKHREAIQAAIAEMKSDEFDPEQMMFDILEAASIDDVLDSEVVHLKDVIGVPMTIKSAQLQDSKFEAGMLPAYAVMRVEFDDGRTAVVTTGAAHVVATLVKAQLSKWYPFRASTTMITTGNGFDVIKLVKAPEKLESF